MGLRETYGPIIEAALNSVVDKHLNADDIKAQLHALINDLVDEKLKGVKDALKEAIDKIDGQDDFQA